MLKQPDAEAEVDVEGQGAGGIEIFQGALTGDVPGQFRLQEERSVLEQLKLQAHAGIQGPDRVVHTADIRVPDVFAQDIGAGAESQTCRPP